MTCLLVCSFVVCLFICLFVFEAFVMPPLAVWESVSVGYPLQGRVLVCADGATSKLATHLGIVKQPPQGSCSRAYVDGGTHKFKADGVVFYHKGLLPGTCVCHCSI